MRFNYGVIGTIRIFRDLLLTLMFFPTARLVRFPIYVRGRSSMLIGKKFTTGVGVRLDAHSGKNDAPVLLIGDNVQLNDAVHIGAVESVEIGDYTLIASRVFISDHNHGNYDDFNLNSEPTVSPINRPLVSKPVKIGMNVWIGEQVCILSGVSIGDGAIIGAGSIVTKDIPSRCIAVGNPAKVIKIYDEKTRNWNKL